MVEYNKHMRYCSMSNKNDPINANSKTVRNVVPIYIVLILNSSHMPMSNLIRILFKTNTISRRILILCLSVVLLW